MKLYLFTYKVSLITCVICLLTFTGYSQFLQKLNDMPAPKAIEKLEPPVTSPPKSIDTVKLRDDNYVIPVKPASNPTDSAFKEVSSKLVALTLIAKENKKKISSYEAKLKNKEKLTEIQEEELNQLREIQKKQLDSINTLNTAAQQLAQELKVKISESNQILEQKKLYRKEYYERLVEDYKANKVILENNYAEFKRQLNSKIDSLRPDRWPLHSTNKDSMVRDMATIYGVMWSSTKELERTLSDIMKNIPAIADKITSFEEISLIMKYGNQPDSYLDSLFWARKNLMSATFTQEKQTNNEFQKKYELYRTQFAANLAKVQQISDKYKPQEKKDATMASVLGNFLTPLNQNSSVVPGIDVLASQRFGGDDVGILGQIKLFMAATGTDTNKLASTTRLFIPEASQFGLMADFTLGFISTAKGQDTKKVALNFSFYYLQKQLSSTDSIKSLFGTGIMQLRSGIELILVKNVLSVYGNLNGFYLGKGVEQFKKNYDMEAKFRWFGELGLRSYLKLEQNAHLNLLLDLRFIPVGTTVSQFTGSADKFIPLFKLGLVKDFSF